MTIEDRFLAEFEPVLREIIQVAGRVFEFHDSSEYSGSDRSDLEQTSHAFTKRDRERPGVELVYVVDSEALSSQNLTTIVAHEVGHFKLDAEGYWPLFSRANDRTENEFGYVISVPLLDVMVDSYLIEMKLDPWEVIKSDLARLVTAVKDKRWRTPYENTRLDRPFRIVICVYWRLHPGVPQAQREQLIQGLDKNYAKIASRASTLAERIREIGLTPKNSYERCLWLLTDRLWGDRRPFLMRPLREYSTSDVAHSEQ